MKHLFFGVLFLVTSLNASKAAVTAESDLGIKHFIEEVAVPSDFRVDPLADGPNFNPTREDDVDVDTILNFANKIWNVIEQNQPVLNVKYQYANALPKGLKSAEDLTGFSDLNRRAFHVWGTNFYGVRVYDVEYVAIHRHGGSYNGVGHYVENATILPQHVEVAWGYTLNYDVTNVSTVNVGTRENPVASLLMETELTVSTILKKSQSREVFEFRGDSGRVRVTGR